MTIHHVAYATRDVHATVRFYDELLGFPLVHTEVDTRTSEAGEHSITHVFFDTGDQAAIAFFTLDNVGETPDFKTDLSKSVGVPVWVNHCAFRATEAKQDEVTARMAHAGIEPMMELDHDWCHSVYFLDPNGIMVELCRDTPGFTPDSAAAHKLVTETHGAG